MITRTVAGVVVTERITKGVVDGAEPKASDYFVWDSVLSGFGLKVTPNGKKIYVQNYRLPTDRRQKRATIGPHGSPWTPQLARKEGERILFGAAQGVDYNAEKKRSRAESVSLAFDAYASLFADRYLKENWPGSYDRAVSTLRCHAIPAFGSTPINKITKRDAVAWLDGLRGNPSVARKAKEVVGKLFRWAEDRGDITSSPFERIPLPKVGGGRDRVLTDRELQVVWLAADRMDHVFGRMLQFLVLSGQRLGEVRGMRWSEIDSEKLVWEVPKNRVKSGVTNVVPMTDAMAGLLQLCPTIGSLVFTHNGETELGNMSNLKKRFDRVLGSVSE